jgi:hypothetical protein
VCYFPGCFTPISTWFGFITAVNSPYMLSWSINTKKHFLRKWPAYKYHSKVLNQHCETNESKWPLKSIVTMKWRLARKLNQQFPDNKSNVLPSPYWANHSDRLFSIHIHGKKPLLKKMMVNNYNYCRHRRVLIIASSYT